MSSYWQGKGAGKKIGIRFNKPLLGDVAGLSAPAFYDMIIPPGTPTASGQYSATYTPDKAFDGSTSTRWYIRDTGDQWIQIELLRAQMTNGFRWYIGSSYRPNGFTVQGSNDGENWTDIYADTSANTTGWKEFNWTATGPYKFYRWLITSRHSSYIYIYEIELSLGMGNAGAFTVKGLVRDPLKYGPLVERTFTVESVERYPETTDTILLTMAPDSRFNDVEGDLTVSYEQATGTLTGNRPVADFEESFTPTDLEPTPIDRHDITAGIEVAVDLIKVDYRYFKDDSADHIITAGITVEVDLIPVSEIPP